MPEVSSLGYVVINSEKLDDWRKFSTEILGMQIGEDTDSYVSFRMDELAHRLIVQRGDEEDLSAIGWALKSEGELDAYVAQLRARGCDVQEAEEELLAVRKVEKLYRCADPNGFRHEFYYGPRILSLMDPFKSPSLVGPGFVTGDLGFGHVLPVARDYAESRQFYVDVIGLKVSDYIRQEIEPGKVADAVFFHTATGRHHSLATGQFPSEKILNHFMVEVADMNDVGLAYDRASAADIPIILDLGHHPNDQMFSFYMVSPSGFGVEMGHGGLVIDEQSWQVVEYNKMSDWGHRRLRNSA
ncbi:Glyoxalase/bleomycin resistance protein/dioxygenase [Hyphomonas adhaerens MHS-3]|uniref:Glyoxalase/bleomycin resistance protein/dioxygenase n=1 Tax=Hyphomonas adhaerens MHS-3 TaxID=1280949 RepID=A0A069E7C6_9PROT|nr:VOC family protein [Hyphomonas adhaerens]KCZ86018.1 Glyoxalase/bleomycin resistance protein/dioxygenase [Hyphomonas adhaerens MHS-3]